MGRDARRHSVIPLLPFPEKTSCLLCSSSGFSGCPKMAPLATGHVIAEITTRFYLFPVNLFYYHESLYHISRHGRARP